MLWFEMRSWASLANSWKQKASRSRRQLSRAARQMGLISERLEDRQLLSAISLSANPPAAQDVSQISPDQADSAESTADLPSSAKDATPHHAKKFKLNLSGNWTIPTPAGSLELNTVQRGKKIRGTADLTDLNLSTLLNLPVQIPVPIDTPPVEFKGKFKKGVLNVNFVTQINAPVIGTPLFEVTGNITARLDFANGIVGHLIVDINGNQVLSTDFTSPLPTLPIGG